MKINEIYKEPLTKFKQSDVPIHQMDDFLQNYGFNRIGEGAFSKIYEHPKLDYILKIFNTWDKGYRTFLSYAIQKNSPYLPQFRGKPMRINETYSAIRMEKLILIPVKDPLDLETVNDIRNFFIYERDYDKQKILKKEIEDDYPGLVKVLTDIAELRKEVSGVSLDISYFNIMSRPGSKIPVIVDPFVGID